MEIFLHEVTPGEWDLVFDTESNSVGTIWGDGLIEKAVWHIVERTSKQIGILKLAPMI
jgi:hypothetical protein